MMLKPCQLDSRGTRLLSAWPIQAVQCRQSPTAAAINLLVTRLVIADNTIQ